MPHISRSVLDKKLENELFESLETVLSKLSKDETKEFLFSLLSRTEKLMLAKRLAIVVLLKENIPTGNIASTLHVTRETVVRVQMQSQIKGNGYDLALQKLQSEEYLKEFKTFLLKLAGYSVRAAGGYVKPEIL